MKIIDGAEEKDPASPTTKEKTKVWALTRVIQERIHSNSVLWPPEWVRDPTPPVWHQGLLA